jgi:hypothetical protein
MSAVGSKGGPAGLRPSRTALPSVAGNQSAAIAAAPFVSNNFQRLLRAGPGRGVSSRNDATIGTVRVAARAASCSHRSPPTMITSTPRSISSVKITDARCGTPSADRRSIMTVRPSSQPRKLARTKLRDQLPSFRLTVRRRAPKPRPEVASAVAPSPAMPQQHHKEK